MITKLILIAVILMPMIGLASADKRQGTIVYADDFPGQDLGARINAADAALGSSPGEVWVTSSGTITTDVACSGNHVIRIWPGLFELAGTSVSLSSGCSLIGTPDMEGTVLRRTLGYSPLVTVIGSGIGSSHAQNVMIADITLDGGMLPGHGIVLEYVDAIRIRGVVVRDGVGGNALRISREAWDFWVVDSTLGPWGDGSHPVVYMEGEDPLTQITDGHWSRTELGGTGGTSALLVSNNFVLQQRFIAVRFGTANATAPYLVDWNGYRTDWIGCIFDGAGATSEFLIRVKNADNRFLGGTVAGAAGDAFHITNGVWPSVGISGMTLIEREAGAGTAVSILADVSNRAKVVIANNIFQYMTKGVVVGGRPALAIGSNHFDATVATQIEIQP